MPLKNHWYCVEFLSQCFFDAAEKSEGKKKIISFVSIQGLHCTVYTHPPEQYLVHGPVPEEQSVVEEAVLYPERVAEPLCGHLAEDGADDNVLGREAAAWNVCL